MIMGTPAEAIVCFLLAAFLGAVGQHPYKTRADMSDGTITGFVLNPRLLLEVIFYICVMLLFVAGFRNGGRVTVIYPIYATTFIWAALIAYLTQGTTLTLLNLAGMLLMIVSVGLVMAGGAR